MTRLKKGDKVIVIAGNDRGTSGEIVRFKGNDRVVVQGVNIRKKNVKSRSQTQPSQVIDMEMPIHISNVALQGSQGGPVRIKVRNVKNGEKEFFYMEKGKEVSHRKV